MRAAYFMQIPCKYKKRFATVALFICILKNCPSDFVYQQAKESQNISEEQHEYSMNLYQPKAHY